jgi:hypothetical protein
MAKKSDGLPEYPPLREMTLSGFSKRLVVLKKHLELHETTAEEWKYFDLLERIDENWRDLSEAVEGLLQMLSGPRERI